MSRVLDWVRARDRGFSALRRASRAAIVMPVMFAIGESVIGNLAVATFAAFGSFAMLILVDFTGTLRDRILDQVLLAAVGAILVAVATAASRNTWLAVGATAVVAFAVIFAGVVSSTLAGATLSLLLAFILPVTLPAPLSSIPERLAGWGLAAGGSVLAIALLWPAPRRDPLRDAAASACALLAESLRADVAFLIGGSESSVEREAASARATDGVDALNRLFFATPYRPTGLSTSARAVVRLVDEIGWLHAILLRRSTSRPPTVNRHVCAVKSRCASVLDATLSALRDPTGDLQALRRSIASLQTALSTLEEAAADDLPVDGAATSAHVITALDPSFRAQEMTFAVLQIASNADLAAMADRRGWRDRLLGRQPAGLSGTYAAAGERAAGHVERHSVWLHNSVRNAAGLAAAVGIAAESGVQHSFWVVLGTLSVLRSSALGTGQNIVRSLLGTAGGFAVGGVLLWAIGSDRTLLWVLLPLAVLVAGFAPAAISFTAGQAAFTVTLLILFNLLQPVGWRVGLVRIEDIAIGCAVSLGVGVLFWPLGAASALGTALAQAYAASATYLAASVDFGLGRCQGGVPSRIRPVDEATRAAAAARRLDDAFRTYLAERGAKPMPLAGVASLVTGVAGVRLAADAVLDLWGTDEDPPPGDRTAASRELRTLATAVDNSLEGLAGALGSGAAAPEPAAAADHALLIEAVRHDLADAGLARSVAVRMIWTADHLDAARRLQVALVEPARAFRDSAAMPHRPRLVPALG